MKASIVRGVPIMSALVTVAPVWFFAAFLIFPFTGSQMAPPMLFNVGVFSMTSVLLLTAPLAAMGLTAHQLRSATVKVATMVMGLPVVAVGLAKAALFAVGEHPSLGGDLAVLAVMWLVVIVACSLIVDSPGDNVGQRIVARLLSIFGVTVGMWAIPKLWQDSSLVMNAAIGGAVGLATQAIVLQIFRTDIGIAMPFTSGSGAPPQKDRPLPVVPGLFVAVPVIVAGLTGASALSSDVHTTEIWRWFGTSCVLILVMLTIAFVVMILDRLRVTTASGMMRSRWQTNVLVRCGGSMLVAFIVAFALSNVADSLWPLAITGWVSAIAPITVLIAAIWAKLAHSNALRVVVAGTVYMVFVIPFVAFWDLSDSQISLPIVLVTWGFSVLVAGVAWVSSKHIPVVVEAQPVASRRV